MDIQTEQQPFSQRPIILLAFPINRTLCFALSFLLLSVSALFIFNSSATPFNHQYYDLLRLHQFLLQIFPGNSPSLSSTTTSLLPRACDYSNGKWVWDESYPFHSYTENCPFVDPGFRCTQNGRKDEGYRKWRWQPDGCDIPRFNASELLERTRNGRIVFVGDSIGRNQWESLLCMLTPAVSNLSTIYEENGKPINKHKGFLKMRFQEYNLTVEYYRAPFLVIIGRPPPNSSSEVNAAIRVDEMHWFSQKWVGADILIFNDGHWWNEFKTVKMGYYFQEGGKLNTSMDVMEAFRRSLQTWKRWVEENLDLNRTHVFFRSCSPVHYRGGTWSEGGHCDTDKEPERDYTKLQDEPENNIFISDVIKQMNYVTHKVQFLNITYLTEFRNDGHPSKNRENGTSDEAPQDCSHWCLPGVPDTWNQLFYANLLSKGFRK
ncbi:protein trichome birefringence-like 9 [Cucurbita moschata]|uniref:Protein trichome birefringence-like 9 n=1 Tax=Cucurbita moschata TaxID=3662 RepID=A0A6J1HHP3_CUCMO|nr:protein trichome birefringence-like 9 [Cucurbita moschata]